MFSRSRKPRRYRAIINFQIGGGGGTRTRTEGPFSSSAAAQAAVDRWEAKSGRFGVTITGRTQQAVWFDLSRGAVAE